MPHIELVSSLQSSIFSNYYNTGDLSNLRATWTSAFLMELISKALYLFIRSYIEEFSGTIKQLYTKRHSKRGAQYDPVLMTTSNVLSEAQISTVMRQVDLLKNLEDRNRNDELFTSLILPEFLIHVFGSEHNLGYMETIERLKLQDEKRTLFNDSAWFEDKLYIHWNLFRTIKED